MENPRNHLAVSALDGLGVFPLGDQQVPERREGGEGQGTALAGVGLAGVELDRRRLSPVPSLTGQHLVASPPAVDILRRGESRILMGLPPTPQPNYLRRLAAVFLTFS